MMQQAEIGSRSQDECELRAPERREETREVGALLVRLAHACVAGGLVAVLLLSLWLEPDARGLGTHEQLLLLPCKFQALTGLPCPSCGMTTAFAYMARGELREAFIAQPLGALGFVVCALLFPVAAWATIRGENAVAAAMRLPWGRLSWAMLAMAGAAWLFKIVVTLAGWRFI